MTEDPLPFICTKHGMYDTELQMLIRPDEPQADLNRLLFLRHCSERDALLRRKVYDSDVHGEPCGRLLEDQAA